MKRWLNRIGLLLLTVLLLCGAAWAADFDAGVTIERSATRISVTVKHNEILTEQTPELIVPCDFSYALVTLAGNEIPSQLEAGNIRFTVARGGTYVIQAADAPKEPEQQQPCDGKTNCPTKDYADVKKDAWYHTQGYVDYVVTRGVMTGTGTTPLRFEPDEKVTRAQMVETLWKMEGKPKITAAEADKAASAFTDVNRDAWYTGSIYWAYTKGLAEGMGDQKFAPDDSMTREQMVTFLYRYAKFKGADVTAGELPTRFCDRTKVGDYAKAPMAWAAKHQIITGMNTTPETIAPQGTALRGQLAKILTVYLQMMG